MAIISASRRTDIPAFFSEWFMNRLEAGSVMVRNPYNQKVSEIPINKYVTDCIVFWTKNPIPMLDKLDRITLPYYFQFTLTGYGSDMERNLPNKNMLIQVFKDLCEKGNGHVIWRYDPIIFTNKYTPEWHLRTFAGMANDLKGYTDRCVISFVNLYDFVKKNMADEYFAYFSMEQKKDFCKRLAEIADRNDMKVGTCAEKMDLEQFGIFHNKCIDPDYIEKVCGYPVDAGKDRGQRKECGCIESVDIGAYNTCNNGCKYCYALQDKSELERNKHRYDVHSPLLCDRLGENEKVTVRKQESLRKVPETEETAAEQLSLF